MPVRDLRAEVAGPTAGMQLSCSHVQAKSMGMQGHPGVTRRAVQPTCSLCPPHSCALALLPLKREVGTTAVGRRLEAVVQQQLQQHCPSSYQAPLPITRTLQARAHQRPRPSLPPRPSPSHQAPQGLLLSREGPTPYQPAGQTGYVESRGLHQRNGSPEAPQRLPAAAELCSQEALQRMPAAAGPCGWPWRLSSDWSSPN